MCKFIHLPNFTWTIFHHFRQRFSHSAVWRASGWNCCCPASHSSIDLRYLRVWESCQETPLGKFSLWQTTGLGEKLPRKLYHTYKSVMREIHTHCGWSEGEEKSTWDVKTKTNTDQWRRGWDGIGGVRCGEKSIGSYRSTYWWVILGVNCFPKREKHTEIATFIIRLNYSFSGLPKLRRCPIEHKKTSWVDNPLPTSGAGEEEEKIVFIFFHHNLFPSNKLPYILFSCFFSQ